MDLLKFAKLAIMLLLSSALILGTAGCESNDNPLTPDTWESITLTGGAFIIDVGDMSFKIPLDTITGKKGVYDPALTPDEARQTIACMAFPPDFYSKFACDWYLNTRLYIDPVPDSTIMYWVTYMESQGHAFPYPPPQPPC